MVQQKLRESRLHCLPCLDCFQAPTQSMGRLTCRNRRG
ncbi:hypothetical protein BLL52_0652 [Rhodoferax antarcticus ANT.BR]|uniref:Uncharacterized protein n=1 Tax=Rhodoferax antarcticus ANT.BR TaxID=1111071 RepID=A0A1Q8YJ33_9BURK|nr:hypothetical protein BLL52_0652 [Rhodoferax antarcticus ANT.BR]